jgi:hypothetical protein
MQLARKLDELERRVGEHDEAIRSLVAAIRQLMKPPKQETHTIGFTATHRHSSQDSNA